MSLQKLKEAFQIFFEECDLKTKGIFEKRYFQNYELSEDMNTMSQKTIVKIYYCLSKEISELLNTVDSLKTVDLVWKNVFDKSGILPKGEGPNHYWKLKNYYINFKEVQQSFGITQKEYIENLLNELQSELIHYLCRVKLVNLRNIDDSESLKELSINKLDRNELLEMMNNVSWSGLYPKCSFEIHSYNDDFSEYWLLFEGSNNLDTKYYETILSPRIEFDEIIKKIKRFLLISRLCGCWVGIRHFFIKKSCCFNSLNYQTWHQRKYNFETFGRNCSVRHFGDDKLKIKDYNQIYDLLDNYNSNTYEEIDRALHYYFEAFDMELPLLIFIKLIMSFESLLNENSQVSENDMTNYVQKINSSSDEQSAKQIIKKLLNYNSALKSFKRAKNLLCPEYFTRQEIHEFLNESFKLRNYLLHGSSMDPEEISKKCTKLISILRWLIIETIKLINENKYDSYENFLKSIEE